MVNLSFMASRLLRHPYYATLRNRIAALRAYPINSTLLRWLSSLFFTMTFIPATCHAFWWDSGDYYHGFMQKPVDEIARLSLENKLIFLDTRERQEYMEGHIPYARNLRLEDINAESLKNLSKAEWIVPYCMKDFRAFEVARALMEQGFNNVILMDPSGLHGWKKAGFPVISPGEKESEAIHKIKLKLGID